MRRWAAVAVIVTRDERVLFIRRTRRDGDPWSEHMGLPGGFRAPADADPLTTAVRETREEVGLALGAPARRLPWRWAFDPRVRRPCHLDPFVFLDVDPTPLRPEPREVAETVWIPLSFLASPTARRREWLLVRDRVPWPAVARRYEGRCIWGLTGRVVDDLVVALGSPPEVR